MAHETEMIDKFFLELAQFTQAKTERQIELEYAVRWLFGNYNKPTLSPQNELRYQQIKELVSKL